MHESNSNKDGTTVTMTIVDQRWEFIKKVYDIFKTLVR